MRREPWPEHVRHQTQRRSLTDGAVHTTFGADVAGGADELGMRVAHLILTKAAAPELVDQVTPGQPMVDHTADAPQGSGREA